MEEYNDRSSLTTPSWFIDLILEEVESGWVLELGCGTGWLSGKMENKGPKVVACDIDKERLKLASKRVSRVVRCDINKLPFTDESFKGVVGIEIIEHLQDPCSLIKEVYRVLEKSGLLFLKTPNRITHDLYQIWQNRLRESRNWHPSVLTHTELEGILKSYGFKAKLLKGNLLESQKEKIGRVFSRLFTYLPLEKLPLIAQPSIYCVAKKV